jgi:surfeit locus 1 family protein
MEVHTSLLSRRWIAAHLTVLAVAGVFVSLGKWQLDRLHERREQVEIIRRRGSLPIADLDQVLPSPAVGSEVASRLAYRRVAVRGTYDPEREVLLEGRSHLGRPGSHVLTPLRTADGSALIVSRGWVPMALDDPPLAEASPPAGEVSVTGTLLSPPPRGPFGPAEPPAGRLERLSRIDIERLRQQLPYAVYPLFLQLERQTPDGGQALPALAPLPRPEEGPHLSYAIQWFSFAVFGAATYIAYLRRQVAGRPNSGGDSQPSPGGDSLNLHEGVP